MMATLGPTDMLSGPESLALSSAVDFSTPTVSPRGRRAPTAEGVLAALVATRLLGNGSNGAVLEVIMPRDGGAFPGIIDGDIPRDLPLALKVASHFWSEDAKKILACELRALRALPVHPHIIRLFGAFEAPIPPHLRPLLPPEMADAVRDQTMFSSFSG